MKTKNDLKSWLRWFEIMPDWKRMHILPRNRFFNVYLHWFGPSFADGLDYGLHDHPWPSLSILLRGQGNMMEDYYDGPPMEPPSRDSAPMEPPSHLEPRYAGGKLEPRRLERPPPRICYRPAEWAHALRMLPGGKTALTLFITGPKRREWGFWRQLSLDDRPGRRLLRWIPAAWVRAAKRDLD